MEGEGRGVGGHRVWRVKPTWDQAHSWISLSKFITQRGRNQEGQWCGGGAEAAAAYQGRREEASRERKGLSPGQWQC